MTRAIIRLEVIWWMLLMLFNPEIYEDHHIEEELMHNPKETLSRSLCVQYMTIIRWAMSYYKSDSSTHLTNLGRTYKVECVYCANFLPISELNFICVDGK